jgi:hypothetical protein
MGRTSPLTMLAAPSHDSVLSLVSPLRSGLSKARLAPAAPAS